MAEPEFISPDEQSAFNMGLAILFRIDKVLTQIAMSKLQGDVRNWYAGLFALKGEIFYKLKEKEREEIEFLFSKVAPLIAELNRKTSSGVSFQNPLLAKNLEIIETKLKEYMDARSMLGVTKKDPRYALSGGM